MRVYEARGSQGILGGSVRRDPPKGGAVTGF